MSTLIYIDHNATTPLDPQVGAAMQPFLSDLFGNPSSLHYAGRRTRAAIDHARRALAVALHAYPDEIVFTSGATEANNLALRGLARAREQRGRHLITSTIEHPSILAVCHALERDGYRVTYVPVDATGRISVQAIAEALTPETTVISVMAANNEVGTLQPVDDIGALAHEHGVALHVDAAQAFGRLPIHVHAWRADTMTISGHKAHGPQGSGALYVRRGVPLEPWLSGGHHEAGRRPGTESVAGIVGLGRLAELIRAHLQDDIQQMQQLRDRLERELTTRIEDVRLNGHPTARLCNTLNVRVPDVSGEALVIQLDLEGIAISTGAACSSGMREPSHVLLAMGRTVEEAEQCVRFSVGRFTTNDEITRVIDAVERAVARMRSVARPSVVAARA